MGGLAARLKSRGAGHKPPSLTVVMPTTCVDATGLGQTGGAFAGTERQRGGASWDSSGEDENSPVRWLNQGNSTLNYTLCDYYGLMFTIAGCNSQRVPTWADPRPRPIAL
jgi:hypothetical protein